MLEILSVVLLGIVGGLLSGLQKKIEPIENLGFFWKSFWSGLTSVLIRMMRFWLFAELFTGLATWISYWVTGHVMTKSIFIQLIILLITLLVFFSITTLAFGLVYGLGVGLKGSDIPKEKRKNSNQGIWQTRNNAVWFALIGMLSLSSIFMPIGWVLGRQFDVLVTTVTADFK